MKVAIFRNFNDKKIIIEGIAVGCFTNNEFFIRNPMKSQFGLIATWEFDTIKNNKYSLKNEENYFTLLNPNLIKLI